MVDSPAYKVPESALGDMQRPVIICDKDDRLIVLYRDIARANGITVVHSLPRAQDPQRLVWTTFDLTTNTLGRFDSPHVDLNRWEQDNVCGIFYEPVDGNGYTAPNTASPIGVLEWDAAAYFNHQPRLQFGLTNGTASFQWNAQLGWDYRLQASSNLVSWSNVVTLAGSTDVLHVSLTNLPAGLSFWRMETREGGF
jgi:hypothetical protein